MPAEDQIDQLKCSNCQDPLVEGDRFCGTCGAPAPGAQRPAPDAQRPAADPQRPVADAPRPTPWPGTPGTIGGAVNGEQELVPAQASLPADPAYPFFGHAPKRPAGPLNNATRYLCAAAYRDRTFANKVIWELIASHRAVVPSVNIDVGPVIRHCLHSRKIILIRDIVLAVLLILALIISPAPTFTFLLISVALGGMLPYARWQQRNLTGKAVVLLIGAITATAILSFLGFLIIDTFNNFLSTGSSLATIVAHEVSLVGAFAVLLALPWATQFCYMFVALRTLSQDLRPGAAPPTMKSGAEARIATVEAAQWGNITLYGGENPFIGTGKFTDKNWSIAIELDRAGPDRLDVTGRKKVRGYAPIDPVELHKVIRERLLKLNDPGLPPHERISGLTVDDALVGNGVLRWTSPLLDLARQTPYSLASPEAIDALIRHPQAGLRYYQKVSVSDEGPPVISRGRKVIDGADVGIAVSGYVYVAVEGRMFYLQFVRTALPPINWYYRQIDLLPNMSSIKFLATVTWQSLKTVWSAIVYSPAGLWNALRLWWREARFEAGFSPSDGSVVGDFGARVSVRELGAEPTLVTHLQKLDVEKYTRVIERLLMDTVLDFLAEQGVDTSAFASSASAIINGDVYNTGPVSGHNVQVGGRGNTMKAAPASGASPSR
jgi:hypothetical protein